MAASGVSLVRLRALCNIAKFVFTGDKTASSWSREMRWYGTKAQSFQEFGSSRVQTRRGE